jgi:two-component system NtrC family sensor kinase
LSGQGIEVVLELAAGLPRTMVDRHQLQEVIRVVTTNAKEAMGVRRKGRLVIQTEVKKEARWRAGEVIEVRFSDDGPGMAAEHLTRVFDPFFTTKPPGQGLGLGLWIGYQIIRNQGGDMYIQSREGQGTTVFIQLPILESAASTQ